LFDINTDYAGMGKVDIQQQIVIAGVRNYQIFFGDVGAGFWYDQAPEDTVPGADSIFLDNAGILRWNEDMSCIQYASKLRDVTQIRRFMRGFIYDTRYNFWIPDIEKTFESGRGICGDFSALYVCMLRSQGTPAKMVYGYRDDEYHAWVEFWDGGRWILADITAEAGRADTKGLEYVALYVF